MTGFTRKYAVHYTMEHFAADPTAGQKPMTLATIDVVAASRTLNFRCLEGKMHNVLISNMLSYATKIDQADLRYQNHTTHLIIPPKNNITWMLCMAAAITCVARKL
jgi:hypothetical protein